MSSDTSTDTPQQMRRILRLFAAHFRSLTARGKKRGANIATRRGQAHRRDSQSRNCRDPRRLIQHPTGRRLTLMQNNARSPLRDPRVQSVIHRLEAERRRPADGGPRANAGASHDPYDYAEYGFSIVPEQGDLIYLLCRGLRATRAVEFATSVGMSTLYFAAAMRDNGGGKVIV